MNDVARAPSGPKFGALTGEGDPSPIRHDGRAPAVLALHGFGGTPREVELVTDVARDLGHRTLAPLHPGHGTHARDLAKTRFEDWARGAREALDSVSTPDSPAIVAGLSMGAVLALHLAVTAPERVRALILLANAIRLPWPFPTVALELVDRLGIPDFSVPKAAADIADDEARRTHLTYSSQPVHAAIEIVKAGERLERLLGGIRCPALIIHGRRDRVCPVENADRVAKRLGSRDKTVVILPRSRHIVTRDLERNRVRSEIERFVRRVAAGARA